MCAGAVTDSGGVDLQIGHVLRVFAAFEPLGEPAQAANLAAIESALAVDHQDSQASGRRLRLRIESLLI